MSAPRFDLSLSLHVDGMTVNDLWPDGDAPNEPSAQDVAILIDECGGTMRVLSDWCLIGASDPNSTINVRCSDGSHAKASR